jgi:DUF4097 and DUF4098 domain-containing protein YvlB
MRRASIAGPLLLILIGGLFLLRNLYPQLPIVDFLAQYWPYLLIGWGALRLLEVLVWAAAGKALPVNGITVGEWIMVFFLIFAGSLFWEGRQHGFWTGTGIHIGGLEVFGDAFDYPLNAGQAGVGKTPHVVIESFRGDARVTVSDGQDIKITGRKTVRALSQGDADKSNQNTPLEIVTDGNQVIIRTNQDRANSNTRVSDDLDITLPKGASLDARGRTGDFDISGLAGPVDITSDNAGVRLQNIGGDVHVDTGKSDVVRAVGIKGLVDLKGHGTDVELQDIAGPVTITGTYVGMVQFRNLAQPVRYEGPETQFAAAKIPGQFRLTLSDLNASNLIGPVRVSSRSKDIQITGFTQSLDLQVDRGDVELRPSSPLPPMTVHTRSGDIDLLIPIRSALDLTASTDRGDITNDFSDALTESQQGNHGQILRGTIGQPGEAPRVSLTTVRGSITVRKAPQAAAAGQKQETFPDIPTAAAGK